MSVGPPVASELAPLPRSILSNGAGLAVNALLSFLLTPILIHRLGTFDYALWTLSASVADYLSLLDLGMRVTLFRFITRLRGANDRLALDQTFASSLCITLAMSCTVMVLTVVLTVFLPGFFGMSGAQAGTFQRLLLLLGLGAAATFPAYTLGTYLCAAGRFDLYNLAGIITGILRALLIVAGLAFGYGAVGIAVITLAMSLLSLLLHWGMLRRADPGLAVDLRLTTRARIQELARFNLYAGLSSVGDFMRFYTHSVVVGRVVGVPAITLFSVAARLLYFFRQLLVGVSSPLTGRIGELEGQSRAPELREFFLRATSWTALTSLFLACHLWLNGRELIRLWVGEAFVSAHPLVLVLAAGYVAAFAQQPALDVLMMRGRHRLRGWLSLAEGVANVLLSVFLARRLGLLGVALGTALPMVVVHVFIVPLVALRTAGVSALTYVRNGLGRPVLASAAFLALCAVLRPEAPHAGLMDFAGTVAWQSALFALLAGAVVLTAAERRRLSSGGRLLALTVLRAMGGRAIR